MRIRQAIQKLAWLPIAVLGALVLTSTPVLAVSQRPELLQHKQGKELRYVAIGDSVASGLGLSETLPSANFEDVLCGRTTEAYPNEVARRANEKLQRYKAQLKLTNLSCQGATSQQLKNAQNFDGVEVAPQIKRAFEGGQPTVMTMTLGANDTRWSDFIGLCFSEANCNTPENTATVDSYITSMKENLSKGMKEVRDRSRFMPPLVVATGYYNPISNQCISSQLTADEAAWVQNAVTKLNAAIYNATEGSHWFAHFAKVDFTGHDICSADSWLQRPGEQAPLHPTARGQEAIANAIFTSLKM